MNNHKSQETNELFKAMSLAQSDMKVAGKDSNNPFFKSSYANLQSVIEASRPSLCKNGLSVMQQIISESGQDYLVTILGHSSGQWLSSQVKIAPQKTDIQSLGSYITYLRRYSYAALVGVYDGTEDDDGNHAMLEQKANFTNKMVTYATEEQVEIIDTLLGKDDKLRKEVLKKYGMNSFYEMTTGLADLAIIYIDKLVTK